MSAAADILRELDRAGIRAERRGDRIRLRPVPPSSLLERARAHKAELLAALPDASARPVLHFRLADHTPNAWATAIGRPGETIDDLRAGLLERFGDRLVEVAR